MNLMYNKITLHQYHNLLSNQYTVLLDDMTEVCVHHFVPVYPQLNPYTKLEPFHSSVTIINIAVTNDKPFTAQSTNYRNLLHSKSPSEDRGLNLNQNRVK